jgi:hypothetical protein
MSQEKVDRHKEEKKNRKKIMAKEKREWFLTKLAVSLIGAAIVVWIGFSTYNAVTTTNGTETETDGYVLDFTPISDYVSSLSAD